MNKENCALKLVDEIIKCVFWFSLQILSEAFLILIRTGRNMINNAHIRLVTYPLVTLFRFYLNFNFVDRFFENPQIWNFVKIRPRFFENLQIWNFVKIRPRFFENLQIWNFVKIRPIRTELFHADRRTDGSTSRQTERQRDNRKTNRQTWRSQQSLSIIFRKRRNT